MDTRNILCTQRYIYSFLYLPLWFIIIVTSSPEPYTSSTMPIPNQREFLTGEPYLLHHTLRVHTSLIHMAFVPLVPSIQSFIRGNCTTWDYTKRQLHGLSSDVCSQYCRLLALYTCRGYTPSNSSRSSPVGALQTDRWSRCWRPNLGAPSRVAAGVNAAAAAYNT